METVDGALRGAAPDVDVLAWYNATNRSDALHNDKPTRALRVKYLLRDRPGEANAVRLHLRALNDLVGVIQGLKHGSGDKDWRSGGSADVYGVACEDVTMTPRDGHVHTEWSWDAPHGSMERACARALVLGLDSIAFTDHADFVRWRVSTGVAEFLGDLGAVVDDGTFVPPPLDVDGYLACVERCRQRFPDLEIHAGVELGEPHRDPQQATAVLDAGAFDLVVAAVHSLPGGDGLVEVSDAYLDRSAPEVVRGYLTEMERMIRSWDRFDVLAHIDYAARSWPADTGPDGAGPYDAGDFEEEHRTVLHALAATERALEVNTRLPLDARVVTWWRQEGGTTVSVGSDAHDSHFLAQGFDVAATTLAAEGFHPDPARSGFLTLG
jgi:histidinol-phosphatase (PHP family)